MPVEFITIAYNLWWVFSKPKSSQECILNILNHIGVKITSLVYILYICSTVCTCDMTLFKYYNMRVYCFS